MKRVYVTGIGVLSPVGNNLEDSWKSVTDGESGIAPVENFDASALKWRHAGELKGFDPLKYIPKKDINRFDPFVHYACAAAMMAVEDAKLKGRELSSAGVIIGSGRGGIVSLERAARGRPSAYLMAATTVSMAASYVSQRLGIRGHALGISTACASGAHSIGEAMRLIKEGRADVVLAGGSEAPICGLSMAGYGTSGALSEGGISRPFDKKRDGFILSEGAAVLVLEDSGHAIERGAKVYGEVAGYGNSSDAFHPTAPDSEGQMRAIKAALDEAKIRPSQVDLISAHATSTPLGDKTEAISIKGVFGSDVPVNALKSMTGHMLGASAPFAASMALMSINEGLIPGTINLSEPEGGLHYIRKTKKAEVRTAVVNSFGFGGLNAVLAIKKAGY